MVDDTKTTVKSEGDGHSVLGDGVHRGREEGGVEGDLLSDPEEGSARLSTDLVARLDLLGLQRNDGSGERDVSREHQEVVVSETTVPSRVHELVQGETIASRVLFEEGKSIGGGGERGGSGGSDRGVDITVDDGAWHRWSF